MERQPSRFKNTIYPGAIRKAAATLGAFLNADAADIAFVDNATTACNAILRSLRLKPGRPSKSSVMSMAPFTTPSVMQPTNPASGPSKPPHLSRDSPRSLLAATAATITPNIRLAVIDHITSASAIVLPAQKIVALCHATGVPVLIDGAHVPAHIDLDLTATGADCYVGNCDKWLCAPTGCAFLHATAARQAGLHPVTRLARLRPSLLAEFDWTGTTDPCRFLAVDAAIDFHHLLDGSDLRTRNRTLAAQAGEHVAQRLNTHVGTTRPNGLCDGYGAPAGRRSGTDPRVGYPPTPDGGRHRCSSSCVGRRNVAPSVRFCLQ